MFIKFLISSVSSSVVDLGLFSLLCYWFRNNQIETGYYIVTATILARICSATYNFLINYKVVFHSQANIRKALVRYIILAVIQMSLSALLVNLVYPLIGGYEVLVKIPVDVFLFLVNYVVQKKVIY